MEFFFPANKGHQSDHAFYTAIVPFRVLGRLLEFDTGSVLERSQRNTDPGRAKAIVSYIKHNHVMGKSFFLPPLIGVIESGDVRFEEYEARSGCGKLVISMDAKIKLIDGQHRATAILQALKELPVLSQNQISIQIYTGMTLKDRQQAFSDINSNSKPVSKSLNLAYNHRDENLAKLNEQIEAVTIWHGKIDRERNQANHRMNHLFSYKHVIAACSLLIGLKKGSKPTDQDLMYVKTWWNAIGPAVGWDSPLVDPDRVSSTVVCLMALARLGAKVRELQNAKANVDPFTAAQDLFEIDWAKTAPIWQGTLIEDGKMIVGKAAEEAALALLIENVKIHPVT